MILGAPGKWPETIPGLGPLTIRAFHPCTDCPRSSWVFYGEVCLCLIHALERQCRAELAAESEDPLIYLDL